MALQMPHLSLRMSQEKGKKFHPQSVSGLAKFTGHRGRHNVWNGISKGIMLTAFVATISFPPLFNQTRGFWAASCNASFSPSWIFSLHSYLEPPALFSWHWVHLKWSFLPSVKDLLSTLNKMNVESCLACFGSKLYIGCFLCLTKFSTWSTPAYCYFALESQAEFSANNSITLLPPASFLCGLRSRKFGWTKAEFVDSWLY